MKIIPRSRRLFSAATILAFVSAPGMHLFGAAPASQDFDALSPEESVRQDNPSLTFGGVIYSTNATNDALRVDTVANVTGSLPTLGTGNALSSVWHSTNTGTFFQFASVINSNDFRLSSIRAEVWGGSSGTAEVYTVTGYNNGLQTVSATVTFTSSGVYGSGGSAITYTRQTTPSEETSSNFTANAGLLTFGGLWDNIDQVRFTVADSKILGISIDQVTFAEPTAIPEPAHVAGLVGIVALGSAVVVRRRRSARAK